MGDGQLPAIPFAQTFAFAPIRTRPKRTYDDLSEDYGRGDHVPKLLARLLNEEPQSEPAKRVRDAIVKFGKESGLFRDVEVKRLGKGTDDPFQVQVVVGSPKVNLMDVGYGVSQALPVIVQSVLRRHNSLLLIQQPEVHLHPRAQGCPRYFLCGTCSNRQGHALIETHSDYLIDGFDRRLPKVLLIRAKVLILFFHKLESRQRCTRFTSTAWGTSKTLRNITETSSSRGTQDASAGRGVMCLIIDANIASLVFSAAAA